MRDPSQYVVAQDTRSADPYKARDSPGVRHEKAESESRPFGVLAGLVCSQGISAVAQHVQVLHLKRLVVWC